jgi:hypothetical protein
MIKRPARFYTAFTGIFLLIQGTSTLLFRLFPALDRAFPALLSVTHMIPPHSLLHILTGVLALVVLFRGGERGPFWFALGFGIFYSALGYVAMSTGHPAMLGLQPFDHPFHYLLGGWGLLAAVLEYYLSWKQRKASL